MDPLVNIQEADAKSVRIAAFIAQFFQKVIFETGALIAYLNHHDAICYINFQINVADFGHFLHAIVNCIFHQRLYGQRRNHAFMKGVLCDYLEFQPFLKADFLDRDIGIYQFQLVGKCYQCLLGR